MNRSRSAGFSLLEVVIALGFLMTLTVAVTAMLKAGFDVKQGLSQRARVLHRLAVPMEKIARDLEQAFIVPTKDTIRNGIGRSSKTIFKIEKNSSGDMLQLTTMTRQPMVKGKHESDITFVVYELKDSKSRPGRKDLYRGESPTIPLDFRDEPPKQIVATDITRFELEFWRGDQWSKDRWDSNSRDTRNRIPRLVKITLESHASELDEFLSPSDRPDEEVEKLISVVHLVDALNYEEMKAQNSSIKWGAF